VKEISEAQNVWEGDGYVIRAFPLKHTKMCFGYALEESKRPGVFYPEKALELGIPRGPLWSMLQSGNTVTLEGGRVIQPSQVMGAPTSAVENLALFTDSLYFPEISREVAHSDLLICEGMFEHALVDTASKNAI